MGDDEIIKELIDSGAMVDVQNDVGIHILVQVKERPARLDTSPKNFKLFNIYDKNLLSTPYRLIWKSRSNYYQRYTYVVLLITYIFLHRSVKLHSIWQLIEAMHMQFCY